MTLITEIPIVTVSMFLYFFNQCQQLMDNRLLRNNVCSVLLKSIYDCKVFGLLTQHFFSISMIYISQKSHSGETPNFFLLECLARYDLWALIIKSCFVCWSGSCISMLYNQRKMYNKYLFIYTENSFRLFHVRYLVRIMFTCLCKLLKSTVFAI